MKVMKEVREFLIDRDKRVKHQEELLKEYKKGTLATVRINYPGVEKSNFINDSIVEVICKEISSYYKKHIVFQEDYKNKEGFIGHFIFKGDPVEIKKFLISIEEKHILGRTVDIDVYYLQRNKFSGIEEVCGISRTDLQLKNRKCFICKEDARICSRAQSHSLEEIKNYFTGKYEEYLQRTREKEQVAYCVSQMAVKAMISEVSTMPSFGLVSPSTMGAHKDMDYYTFVDSAFILAPYIKEMALLGYSPHSPKEIFETIRFIGMDCEKAMLKGTNGVNTHKGMIFLMGIVTAAAMKTLYENYSFNEIENVIKEMCKDILSDFNNIAQKQYLTNGERLFRDYGFKGIRGEVQAGLPIVFKEILPKFLTEELKGNNLYAHTLLELMTVVEDSTIVHRHGLKKLKEVQEESKEILRVGGYKAKSGKEAALIFEQRCIEDNISPGGSADLLAILIFLREFYCFYFENK